MSTYCCNAFDKKLHKESEKMQVDNGTEVPKEAYGFWNIRSFRFHLTMALCCAMLANSLVRSSLSMAMVCMVNSTALFLHDAERKNLTVSRTNSSTLIATKTQAGCDDLDLITTDYDGQLVWTSKDQGFLFSAVYWGGVFSSLPGGWLSNRYSPKVIVLCCFALQISGCFLSPVAAVHGGVMAMFAIRLLTGVGGQAVLTPCISQIISQWIPKKNRSTVLALYTAGNQIAMVIAMPLNAWLCKQKYYLGGWPSIFYVNGVFVIVAIIIWAIFVHDNPDKSGWISNGEREHIKSCLANDGGQKAGADKAIAKTVPWGKLFKSMALWSCILCSFANGIMATTLISYVPTYYKEALHLNLKSNGIFSTLPYLSQWAAKLVFAIIADYFRAKTKCSPNVVCKVFNSIGTFAVAAFLVATSFTDCTQTTWAIISLALSNGMFSGQIPGYLTSLLCIAPAYTGLINGIARFAGQVAAVLAPYMVGLITVHGTANEWRSVFFILAAIMVAVGLHFVIFGSVDVQDWAKPQLEHSAAGVEMTNFDNTRIMPAEPTNVGKSLPDVVKTHEGTLLLTHVNDDSARAYE